MNFFRLVKTLGGVSALVLAACAPLPPNGAATDAAASAAQAAASVHPAAPVAPAAPPNGEQRIAVGGANGFQTTLTLTPPKQVCDNDAFADGVRYGYALTWNRLLMEQARDGANSKTLAARKFDPSGIHSQDDQYKIQWSGTERSNACASDGYLIGRVVGTHRAAEDMRANPPS